MAEFEHFLLTRFSVVFTHEQPPADDAWLQYRLAFFVEALCASVDAQSTKQFRWLVFFDDRAADEFREQVRQLSAGLFEPVWLSEPFSPAVVARELAARSDAEYLITTRVDSDDALGVRFVETVQAQFERQDRMFVNLARGLQVDRTGAIYLYDYPSNPFVSLIERRVPGAPPLSVFVTGKHRFVRNFAPLREVITGPLWLQVVHDANLMNEVRGRRVSPKHAERAVVMDLDYRHTVSLPRLGIERLAQVRQLGPRLVRDGVVARWDRVRGTRTLPQWSSPR